MNKTKAVQALLAFTVSGMAFSYTSEWDLVDSRWLSEKAKEEISIRCQYAESRLSGIRYPEIPDVHQIHLPDRKPMPLFAAGVRSSGLCSPILEEARELEVFDDYKFLSDLRQKKLTLPDWNQEVARITAQSEIQCQNRKSCPPKDKRKIFLKNYIDRVYNAGCELAYFMDPLTYPKWEIRLDATTNEAFTYVENHWYRLVKLNPISTDSSLLLNPYPFLIPAGRFREAYYWDSFFGLEGLLATGRSELARMQAENILYNIRRFGFVPNGQRDYYLSRSQAPFSATIVRRVVEESLSEYRGVAGKKLTEKLKKWVSVKALPLLEKELKDFWMNPETRYDKSTGLHHHWDDLNIRRPERHSNDKEEELGLTYRDVRAAAESGLDFTNAFVGSSGKNEITSIASVILNSMLFKYMKDLEWLADLTGDKDSAKLFARMAHDKKEAVDRYLWNPSKGHYQSYHLEKKKSIEVLSAATFVPLFAGLSSQDQATKVLSSSQKLWKKGGIAASELWNSPHQWDGNNGWAPYQMMAVQGMLNYGFRDDARELANRWTSALTEVFKKHRGFFERVDLDTLDLPKETKDKYPVQEGFLWTNASYVWMLTRVLGYPLIQKSPQ